MKRRSVVLAASLLCLAVSWSCGGGAATDPPGVDPSTTGNTVYKQQMRAFVQGISAYARGLKPGFIVIPQNGHELVTTDGAPTSPPDSTYLAAIDGVGREDLFYGYVTDDVATAADTRDKIILYMDVAKAGGVLPLVTDYCSTRANVDDSYARNLARGYTSFAADSRELDRIPGYPAPTAPMSVNTSDVTKLAGAKNFLYLLNSSVMYATKAGFLAALAATSYDAFVIDLYFDDVDLGQVPFTAAEIATLRTKPGGGSRLVIAYMSIGEAESYRFYWDARWRLFPPPWLEKANPDWPGNYKVRYWDPAWQAIIFGNDASYLKRILDAGFDGTYLDIIDAFEYFEARM